MLLCFNFTHPEVRKFGLLPLIIIPIVNLNQSKPILYYCYILAKSDGKQTISG